MLSSSMQLLHMNRQATELSKLINMAENGGSPAKAAQGASISAYRTLCRNYQSASRSYRGKDWEQFEVKRIAGNPNQPVLLRGFGLPDRGGINMRDWFVTLEELGRRQQLSTDQAKERFQLTNREQSVVENLAKGWTNKGDRERSQNYRTDGEGTYQTHHAENKLYHSNRVLVQVFRS